MKLADHVSIGENEVETEANAPDSSLSNFSEIMPFSEEVQPVVDTQFINQLKTYGLFDHFLARQRFDQLDVVITSFFFLSLIQQVNLIKTIDFEDIFKDSPNRTQPLDLVTEQQNDEVFQEVIFWKNRGNPDVSPNPPLALRTYRTNTNRLVVFFKKIILFVYFMTFVVNGNTNKTHNQKRFGA